MAHGDLYANLPPHALRDAALQRQLMARRERLRDAAPALRESAQLQDLLQQVDATLERIEAGTYGLCETCHDDIEDDRLLADPFCRNCLDHLSAAEQRALERDLDLAFQVQRGFLPQAGPAAKGWTMAFHYQPAGAVSGDYCDLIRHEDGTSLFLLGDVMGKGIAASILTAHLHAIFRSLGAPGRPLQELVAMANRVFCEGTITHFFATLVCGRLGRDGEVELCNAGHCYPLHLQGDAVARIETTGLPLGVVCDAEYTTYRAQIAAGDGLVIHSDGLSEALDGNGDLYGDDRLSGALRRRRPLTSEQLLAALLADLGTFRRSAPMSDDLTVMVMQRDN